MKPFISIYIEKVYRLRLTMGTILEYEQLTENKLSDIDTNNISQMTALLWLMIKREDITLSLEETESKILKAEDKTELFIAARQAIESAFSENKSNEQESKSEYFEVGGYVKIAAEIGISLHELWDYTPAEFSELFNAYIKNRKIQINDIYKSAWYSAYFGRVKTMPKLSDMLIDTDPTKTNQPKREQTDDEMMNACKLLCMAFGGEVVEV